MNSTKRQHQFLCFSSLLLLFVVSSISAFAQEEGRPIHPSLYKRHSAGMYMTQYMYLGASYRYRSPKGLGTQVSYSPSQVGGSETVEVAALYTLTAGTTPRYFFNGRKSYNIFVYANNITSLVDNKLSLSNSISLGFEEVHWEHVAINLSLGYIIRPSTNFPLAVGFGAYYKF